MFVRQVKRPQHTAEEMCIAVQIVQSVRDGRYVRQRVVKHIGLARDEVSLEALRRLGEYSLAQMLHEQTPQLFPPEELAELTWQAKQQRVSQAPTVPASRLRHEQTVTTGFHEVYGLVYRELGLDRILPPKRYRASHRTLFHTVMTRLAHPDSKRASAQRLATRFGHEVSLAGIYRMMDLLDEARRERVRRRIGEATRQLLPGLDVLFLDCTTLVFESVTADDLREFGYSKDGKPNRVQVVLALVVTEQGLPVTYEVFPGNQFEGHTLIPMLRRLEAQFGPIRSVLVADRGMTNQVNLKELERLGVAYVMGARLHSQTEKRQDEIMQWRAEVCARPQPPEREVMEMNLTRQRRLVVWYDTERAEADAKERQRAIERARKRLKRSKSVKSLVKPRGAQRFLKIEGDGELTLNEEAIRDASRWDGLVGLVTCSAFSPAELRDHYRGLWQVEQSFRVNKHDLRIRPVFHWTPRRVRAHIAIAYMAFACLRQVEHRLRIKGHDLSPARIHAALNDIQDIVMRDEKTDRHYILPGKLTRDGEILYQVFGLQRHSRIRPMPA